MDDQYEVDKSEKLAALGRTLSHDGADRPRADFAKALFRHVAAEDVAAYTPDQLAALAEDAWRHFQHRPFGRHRIRSVPSDVLGAGQGAPRVTIVEILNDDMPFLFGSVMAELQTHGLDVTLVVHPIYALERDGEGNLTTFHGPATSGSPGARESLIHVHVNTESLDDGLQSLFDGLEGVLADVRRAVTDWDIMRRRVRKAIRTYESVPPPIPEDRLQEAVSFLDMLVESDYVFLGVREYRLEGTVDDGELVAIEDGGLGILRDPNLHILRRGREPVTMTPEIREFLKRPEPLIITKANARSRVHRRTHLDYVGVKLFDPSGALSGELRLVGLFTSDTYNKSVLQIPYVRGKVRAVMKRLSFDPQSHSGKVLLNILEHYPRDELFQIDEEMLAAFALAILQLNERPRVRVLSRIDKFDRFVSILVFLPRDRFTTKVRLSVEALMAEAYQGHVSARYTYAPEGPLVRLHIIIGRTGGETPSPAFEGLEEKVRQIVRTWADDFVRAVRQSHSVRLTPRQALAYADAFSESYVATYSAETALADVMVLEALTTERPTAIHFLRRPGDEPCALSLKIYNLDRPIPLSDRVPILESMGFLVVNERTFRIAEVERRPGVYMHDMTLRSRSDAAIPVERLKAPLEDMFLAVWNGEAENDPYNALLCNAGIRWREIALLRAIAHYLLQANLSYGLTFMAQALNNNSAIAADLVELFRARFDPERPEADRESAAEAIRRSLAERLNEVASLTDDTIIRRYQNVIDATLRTNYYQREADGRARATISFKLDPHAIQGLPKPRPFREIWVYSPRVEGVHLRFGAVARGGLRWSDRPQDFRTEVLGLVKAQQVKNAVIVPVGAKGGFFPKRLPDRSDREGFAREGKEAYKVFVSSLLDITDDLEPTGIVPPAATVRYDQDDPYLVVAADKGTATFSDTANAIAEAHGFWLGDAFASGGSEGYDHKAMGITARGAWEAVKRHFREMDWNIQDTPFTVAGVGDMSGDVFGNGMLLSRATRLVAAFDHRDIFIDPDPDPDASFAERQRLFALPRSSWQDYDTSKLSAGGAIYSRSLKRIRLSAEACAALGIEETSLTPADLIRAILRAPVDLLWFGGIGTYVRGASETDAEVGDKTNDGLRVSAREVRAKVIGEGANLAVTQRGRIEYALAGGRCNSDAIDNSAGVNTSDVEVNIKVALGAAERAGRLTREDRNRLLVDMTDEVARLVLRNNYLQTLAISVTQLHRSEAAGFHVRLMQVLERHAGLDRELEALPSDEELLARAEAGGGLTRPEIGVLLSYSKIMMYRALLASEVPDDAYLSQDVLEYFPAEMRERFKPEIEGHQLRREIIATMLANSMINDGGPSFAIRVGEQTGASVDQVAIAFTAARETFDMWGLLHRIGDLDNKIPGMEQLGLHLVARRAITEATVWFIRNWQIGEGIEAAVAHFREGVASLRAQEQVFRPEQAQTAIADQVEAYRAVGVPEAVAREVAALPSAIDCLNIILVADQCDRDLGFAAHAFYAADRTFSFSTLDDMARRIDVEDYYDGVALDQARRRLSESHRRIAAQIISCGGPDPGVGRDAVDLRLSAWLSALGGHADQALEGVNAIVSGDRLSISRLAVAASLLADLAGRGPADPRRTQPGETFEVDAAAE